MSALAGFPNLSQLLAWPTEHLTEAADHWEAVGSRSYALANRVWRDSLSVDWQGEAADALRTATHADMLATSGVADQLEAAAKIARSGASDLYGARSRVRYSVEDARAAGFAVGEDLSVTDRSRGGSAALRAARQAQAQAFVADIRQRAAQLVALDQQVGGKVTAAMASVRDTFPPNSGPATSPQEPKIQAVDNHTFKQEPPPPGPPGNPFAGWTEEQKAQVATEIAHGHALEHFPGKAPQDLARWIYDAMNDPNTRVGTSIKSGGLALLRDGQVVFINPQDGDYGTAFAPTPRPGDSWRTPTEYFEQNTRVPEPLPPPTPGRLPPVARGEMAPATPGSAPAPAARPAPLPPAPVEAPPAPKGPSPVEGGEGFGGGPAIPFGPRLEPPPHAGHHHPPVLGDMDPDPWDHGE
ncbi:hypothetical protein [Mycobacterium nebraskense]|uniref:hypothetical protein n=1 Tax=Mycobacterium nebraskense TaxID=244292 RepID=UPI000AB89B9B|nr:hypothetical protein [Mycobacterium nebraskense]MBI2693390.1 hypothetical protein [Mycobacterium nebraskense]MCV7119028.1 hypothetical protein [Mycobacterium nebraskense]